MSWSRECSTLAGLLSTMGWDSGPMESKREACIHFSLWPERTFSQELEKRQNSAASRAVCALNYTGVGFLGICQGFHLPHEYA